VLLIWEWSTKREQVGECCGRQRDIAWRELGGKGSRDDLQKRKKRKREAAEKHGTLAAGSKIGNLPRNSTKGSLREKEQRGKGTPAEEKARTIRPLQSRGVHRGGKKTTPTDQSHRPYAPRGDERVGDLIRKRERKKEGGKNLPKILMRRSKKVRNYRRQFPGFRTKIDAGDKPIEKKKKTGGRRRRKRRDSRRKKK